MIKNVHRTTGGIVGNVTLPSRDALMRRLRACDDDRERVQNLFPLICDHLYQNGNRATVEQVGSSLVAALKWYVDGMKKGSKARLQAVTVLRNRLDDYVSAISFTFTDPRMNKDLWDYCDSKKTELTP